MLVEAKAADRHGVGYTYADTGTARLIQDTLAEIVKGRDAMDVPACWAAMLHEIRNLGRPGIVSTAVSAIDAALWDLKARLLNLPLVKLLGAAHAGVPVYGSGGFTSYSIDSSKGSSAAGRRRVSARQAENRDSSERRHRASPRAREAIGPDHCSWTPTARTAARRRSRFAEAFSVLERELVRDPVSSDDLEGLRLIRDRAPAGMDITAGEYGYDLFYFRRMLEAGAVDVLQADASRCWNYRLSQSRRPVRGALSSHFRALRAALTCMRPAPSTPLRHLEYFHDHVRIERMLFDGAHKPEGGGMYPDLSRPGMGLEFKRTRTLARTPCSIHGGRLCSVTGIGAGIGEGHRTERRQRRPTQTAQIDAQALAAELRGIINGEVRFDDRQPSPVCGGAAPIYRQVPIGVVIPRDCVDDVIATVAACRRHGRRPLPRAAGPASPASAATSPS